MSVSAAQLYLSRPASPPADLEGPAPGYPIGLGSRGEAFYREVPGPPGAPTLVLLHGWVATGALNWFQAFEPLARQFRVIAPDLRGHGRGIRSERHFDLEDCADDVAALLERLDTGPAIAVGYSMGGPVAQLLWRRHREQVAGLVLCATSHAPVPSARNRLLFRALTSVLARATRSGDLAARLPRSGAGGLIRRARRLPGERIPSWVTAEFKRHDVRMLIEAGHALGGYDASEWIGEVDVPTAVVVTVRDRALRPWSQVDTALRIRDAAIHRLEAGHLACARPFFGPALLAACRGVAERAS